MNEGDTGDPVRGRRRGAAWSSVAYGLHVPAGAGETAALQAWQLLLPRHGCFTHLTGASLRGWWLPPLPEGLPVFVALRPNDVRPDREGIRSIRTFGTDRYDLIDGVRVAGATEILLACARDVGLLDLVVLIDAALHSSDLTLDELAKAASRRRRGAPALRRALGYAHPKSESAWETLLRVCHRVCDIDVEPQHEVSMSMEAWSRAETSGSWGPMSSTSTTATTTSIVDAR